MRALGALITISLALTICSTARGEYVYAGQQQAPYPIPGLVQQAVQFWADRGVTGCPAGIEAWEAPSLAGDDEDAPARGADCEIWLTPQVIAATRWAAMFNDTTRATCAAVTHEVGHALGLAHSTSGIMAGPSYTPPSPTAWTPWFCRVWAREYINAALRRHGIKSNY